MNGHEITWAELDGVRVDPHTLEPIVDRAPRWPSGRRHARQAVEFVADVVAILAGIPSTVADRLIGGPR